MRKCGKILLTLYYIVSFCVEEDNMSVQGKNERRIFMNATARLITLALILLLQMAFVAALSVYLQRLSVAFLVLFYVIAFFACVIVSEHHDNPSTRFFWLLLIALFPAFGILIYLMWGRPRHGERKHSKELLSQKEADDALILYAGDLQADAGFGEREMLEKYPSVRNASQYLHAYGFPVFSGTKVFFLSSGESFFADCLSRMRDARKSIFMSFFILRAGKLWDQFYRILCEKAEQGIDIRILIDDAGTMFNISPEFIRDLQQKGMQIRSFNPTHRYLNNLYLNYRNHQKIIVIDSETGYTGGMNLADEYANFTSPYGYWKDTGVRLDGQGVFGLTVTFINMWDQTGRELSHSYGSFRPTLAVEEEGLCQVFSDGPLNNPKNPAEGLIYRMIESAHDYVYLTTPYLAVSQALIDTIGRSARSGVRVVLLVPQILDHWYVFEVTQSHFSGLIDAGVEIYRFTPGMLHAKMIVADDVHALVGTINLDNRSFFSQYEDGVWFCGKKAVSDVKTDIENSLTLSYRVTAEDCRRIGPLRSLFGLFLRIFSPLM